MQDSIGGRTFGDGLSGATPQSDQTDEESLERIDAGRGHISIQTVMRNEPEIDTKKQKVEKARIIAGFDKLFRGDPETLKRNRDELYVLGQKYWLSSRNARPQENSLEIVANGVIGQFINIQPSDKNGILGLNEYPMLVEEVNHMNDVRGELVQKLGECLNGQEFSEQRQRQLKKQALREFIQAGYSFMPGGWAEKGTYVFAEGQPGQRLDGAQILQREGFVDNNEEWQELRREAAEAAIEHSRLTLHTIERAGDRAPEHAINVKTPIGYRELFGLKFPLNLLVAGNEANRQEVAGLVQEMPAYHDSVYNFVNYEGIIRGENWTEIMSKAKAQKLRSAGYAAAEAFPIHQLDTEEREALLNAVQSIATNVELPSEDQDKRAELEALSASFTEAFSQGAVRIDADEIVMMRPWEWLSQNGNTIEQLRREAGVTQNDDGDDVLSGLLPGRFTGRMVTKALGRILQEKDWALAHDKSEVVEAARASVSDYLSIIAGSTNAQEILANLEKSQQYDPILEECMPADLKPVLMSEHVKDIANGVSGMEKLYFFNPLTYDPEFSLAKMAEKVPAVSPNETLEQKEARLLEDSYLGLFEILLAEGKLGPKGVAIQQSHRENAANQYFKAFNYGEHLSNLNLWLDEKVNELKDAGEENQAQELLKRFKHWTQNPAVREAFEAYRKQAAEEQNQLEQAQRDTEAQIIEGVTIGDIQRILAEQIGLDFSDIDSRFQDGIGYPTSRSHNRVDSESVENYSMPLKVSEARIKMHAAWSEFIKNEFPDGNVDECMMIFHRRYDQGAKEETIRECLRHLDGNTYMAVAFSDIATGKRCMIAECLGTSGRYAVSGAMKVWLGDISDQDGWKEIFRRFSKSEANAMGAIGSINHVNVTADVMENWSNGEYVIPSIEDMYKLAMLYFETGDKKFLSNTIANRKFMEQHPLNHHWR